MNDAPIVVGIDGSDHSHTAVAWAIDEARARGARVEIVICQPVHADVHAFGAGPAVHGMDALDLELTRDRAVRIVDDVRLRGSVDPRGIDIDVAAHSGPPAEHLIRLSDHAQLLVVGRRDGHRLHGQLGSVSTAVTHHSRCPVAIIR